MSSKRVGGVLAAIAVLTIVFSPSIGQSTTSTVDAVASFDPTTLVKTATINRGSAVSFYGSGSRGIPPLAYNWSFRDGSTSVEANPMHTYDQAGTYEVSLVLQDGSGRMDLDRVTVRVRQPLPGLDFDGVDAGADRSALEDEPLAFEALVAWPGADPSSLSYAWDFGDGTPVADGATVSHAFENAGSYTVGVTVTDSNTGAFDGDQVAADIANIPPFADAGADSVSAFEDDLLTFDARATYDTPSDRRDLAYAWDFGDGQRGSGEIASHAYAHAGPYLVQLTATDDNGVASTDSVSVHVDNAIPLADAGAPLIVAEGDPATFDARGSTDTPSDRSSLEYGWAVDPTLPLVPGWGPSYTWFDEGLRSVGLVVTDDDGASAASALSVGVANAPPRVGITGIWWFQNELLLEGYAFDPGADDLTFEWSVDGHPWYQSVFRAGGVHPRAVYGYALNPPRALTAREWRVTLTVADGDGGVGEDSVTLLIARTTGPPRPPCAVPPTVPPDCALPPRDAWSVDNLAPRVEVAERTTAFEDLTMPFQASFVDDPDSQNLTFLWEFGNGDTADGAVVLHGFRAAGTYTVIVTVSDGEGDRTSDAMIVVVENVAPVASLSPPADAREDETIQTWGHVTDTPSDQAELLLVWKFSDDAVVDGAYARHAFTRDGPASIRFIALDNNGASSESRVEFDVENVAPLAVSRGPTTIVEGDSIVLEAVGSIDTSSDAPLLTYEWRKDGFPVAAGRNPVISGAGPGAVTFQLQVRDDRGASDIASVQVEVEKIPPRAYAGPDLLVYGATTPTVVEGYAGGAPGLVATWTFSDGGSAIGLLVTHSFAASGVYDACLSISDGTTVAVDCARVELSRDTDGDNLLDEAELLLGTDPALFDTDGDSLTDFYEYMASHTDPTRTDTDGDALNDWEELWIGEDSFVTDPTNADTDQDGLTDGEEFAGYELAYNGRSPESIPSARSDHSPGRRSISLDQVGTSAPGMIRSAILEVEIAHPDVSRITVTIGYSTSVVVWSGQGTGTSLDLSVDLLTRFGRDAFETKRTWILVVSNRMGSPGELRGMRILLSVQTSPVSADSDGDGLSDHEETVRAQGSTSDPWSSDTDNDGIADGTDLAPSDLWQLPWSSEYAPGLVRFTQKVNAFAVQGMWAGIYTWHKGWNGAADTCDWLSDHKADSTRDSDTSVENVRTVMNKVLTEGGETNITVTEVRRRGVEESGWPEYIYGACDFWAPRQYRIMYQYDGIAYDVDFVNTAVMRMPDAAGNFFQYATLEVPIETARPQSIIVQVSIRADADRTQAGNGQSPIVPGLVYHLHPRSDFTAAPPAHQSLAVGTPLGEHGYEFHLRVPQEVATDSNTFLRNGRRVAIALLSPVWLASSGSAVSKEALDPSSFRVAAIMTDVSLGAETLLARLALDPEELRQAMPSSVSSGATGYYTVAGRPVYVYHVGDSVPFDPQATSRVDAVFLWGASGEALAETQETIVWQPLYRWVLPARDGFSTTIDLMKIYKRGIKLIGEVTTALLAPVVVRGSTLESSFVDDLWTVVKTWDVGAQSHQYVISRLRTETIISEYPHPEFPWKTMRDVRKVPVESRVEIVDDLDKSTLLTGPRYQTLKAGLRGAAIGAVAVIMGTQAVLAYAEGDVIKGTIYAAATATAIFGIVKADTILFADLAQRLRLRGGGMRLATAATIAVGALLVGYELYLWSQTNDPIEKLAHIENAVATVVDTGISLIPLYGAVVELSWGLGANLGAWAASLFGLAPNALALKIVSSPGTLFVFFWEYVFASAIPSSIAEDALSQLLNFLAYVATFRNSMDPPQPTILLVP